MENDNPIEEVETRWKKTFSARLPENICHYFERFKGLKVLAPKLVIFISCGLNKLI